MAGTFFISDQVLTFDRMKRSVVIGASLNPSRYSHEATRRLAAAGEEVIAVGLKAGHIGEVEVHCGRPTIENADTVTLYVGPQHHNEWVDYLLSLKPRRVIFNPGTENPSLVEKLHAAGIDTEVACTLVLLATGAYRDA